MDKYYTRTAERAARAMERKHRAQERERAKEALAVLGAVDPERRRVFQDTAADRRTVRGRRGMR